MNYEDVVGLYFFFLVSCKKDVVGRSVGRLFVHSFRYSKFPSILSSPFVIRYSSFIYLTTASLVLVANRRFFCFLSTCGVATFASGGEQG